ncbi:MAG: outer membrane protein assembly factor BamD [Chlamydiota bacterium]
MIKTVAISFFSVFLAVTSIAVAKSETSKLERVVKAKTAHDFYNDILNSYQKQDWKGVVFHAKQLLTTYAESPFNAEAFYYKGVAYYNLKDYDIANEAFTKYLRNETTPKFFEDAIEFKFRIAERFYEGARIHLLGFEKLPKVFSSKEEALAIYEEIITTLPRHDLTAKSLYKKGCILCDINDYKLSVEAFQTLIRRFPKHYLAPEGFLGIQKVYLKQCEEEFPDPDILQLADINLQKFKEHFPGEPRAEEVKNMLIQMEDRFAKDLFETGNFYERTKKEDAAIMYYTSVLAQYPHSTYADKSQKSLEKLQRKKMIDSTKNSKKTKK